jgi:hypothetical protein
MASTKRKSAFYNVSTGLVWMLTSLPIFRHAIDVKYAAQTITRRLPCSPACPSQLNRTSASMLTFLDP